MVEWQEGLGMINSRGVCRLLGRDLQIKRRL
jgi:hypothetical protein